MSGIRFGLHETSEKTIENNVLSDISNFIQNKMHRQVTIISPTQKEELTLGFDDIIEGLPPGCTLAFQFKRPYPYSSKRHSNFAKFVINTLQLQTLLGNFFQGEAFYVFVPLPTTQEIVRNRSNLLALSLALDIYDVPKRTKTTQKTRVVRVTKSSLSPNLEIADPRKFDKVEKVLTLENICNLVGNMELGRNTATHKNRPDAIERKAIRVKGIHYIHVSEKYSNKA